jgi:hypothetical protein
MTDHERATPRPWYATTKRGKRDGYIRQLAGVTVADVRYKNGEADAALIVEAVNNYDRLLRIEAAARTFMEVDDGPPDLPDDEWEPAARVLWDALSEPSS